MICPRCGSNNVNVQIATETQLVNKHRSIWWWLCIGWWWIPIKWMVFTLPALFGAFAKSKDKKLKTKHVSMCVCQNCGNNWKSM